MTPIKLLVAAVSAMVSAPILLFLVAAAALVVTTARGVDVTLPGLVHVVAGAGDDIASARLDGSGVLVWWLATSAVVFAVTVSGDRLVTARRTARRG